MHVGINLHLQRATPMSVERFHAAHGSYIALNFGGSDYPHATVFLDEGHLAELRDIISDFLAPDRIPIDEEAA